MGLEISFNHGDNHYRLEATSYGVDIFVNGKYYNTLHDEMSASAEAWIGVGIESIFEPETYRG